MSCADANHNFSEEKIYEIPSCHRDGISEGRHVRIFIKGPSYGITSETRILVYLHGIGGRNLDISYKRFRKIISDEHNCIVMGIDFFGTHTMWKDPVHWANEKRRLTAYVNKMIAIKNRALPQDGHVYEVDPTIAWFTSSRYSAQMLSDKSANDCWDYGIIQALDVAAGIRWLLNTLRHRGFREPRALHLLAQSAGCQVAACVVKLLPQVITSVVEVSPFLLRSTQRHYIRQLLTDPVGMTGVMIIQHEINVNFLRKSPVMFIESTAGFPALEDHIDLRLIDFNEHWNGVHSSTQVLSFIGVDDPALSIEELESIQSCRRNSGMTCYTEVIDAARVDGTIFTSVTHNAVEDMVAFQRYIAPRMFSVQTPTLWPEDWTERVIKTKNGRWSLIWKESPALIFSKE